MIAVMPYEIYTYCPHTGKKEDIEVDFVIEYINDPGDYDTPGYKEVSSIELDEAGLQYDSALIWYEVEKDSKGFLEAINDYVFGR